MQVDKIKVGFIIIHFSYTHRDRELIDFDDSTTHPPQEKQGYQLAGLFDSLLYGEWNEYKSRKGDLGYISIKGATGVTFVTTFMVREMSIKSRKELQCIRLVRRMWWFDKLFM